MTKILFRVSNIQNHIIILVPAPSSECSVEHLVHRKALMLQCSKEMLKNEL